MTRMMGIDGCRAGWFAVINEDRHWHFALATTLSELLYDNKPFDRVFIDIPIGLHDSQPRQCDRLARRLLSPLRHNSVFTTPVRDAIYARDYASACEINARLTGRKLTRQAWNICPKIREMDRLLRQHPGSASRIYESHPEVAFYALNGEQPLATPKKSAKGQAQRLALLQKHLDGGRALFEQAMATHPRSQVQADDILDAMVLGVMAEGNKKTLISLPDPVEQDRFGLPMRIVYSRKSGA